MELRRALAIAAAVLVTSALALGAAFAVGVVGLPTATVVDVGDWGAVEGNRTEIVSTVEVHNPNPVGLQVGGNVRATYTVSMNDVVVADGEQRGLSIPPGNSTHEFRTFLRNDRLADWWVAYVRANETLEVRTDATLHVSVLGLQPNVNVPPRTEVRLENETPFIDAISAGASRMEGRYTRNVSVARRTVTIGYDVERAYAEWGPVDRNTTVVYVTVEVRNPGDVPVPAVPDGIAATVEMNDVPLIGARGDEFTVRGTASDAVIRPGETRTVTYVLEMDNDRIDEWFVSHVQNDERSRVDVQFQLIFRDPRTGTTVRVPSSGGVTYSCEFQTAILVDDVEAGTTCGSRGVA